MPKPSNNLKKSNGNGASSHKVRDATESFEEALKDSQAEGAEYILRLYVVGSSARSLRAVYNLKKLCEEFLPEGYDLEVIDIYKNPAAARDEQIVAVPTLIKSLPAPLRRFVGDLSNTHKLLVGMGLYQRQNPEDQLGTARP
jgi:circadian clock protein KaiB